MEHLPKFRRKPKNPAIATETKLATAVKQVDAPSPKEVIVAQQKPKRSAFRALHLRGATKRARSPPPAALPQSPSHAVVTHDGVVEPSSGSRPPTGDKGGKATPQQSLHKAARIPSFLTLSAQDVEGKYQELIWAERNRIAEGMRNEENDPEHKWAHFRQRDLTKGIMDRYSNIKPWNHNRIKLRVPGAELDYVNASPIILTSPSDPKLPPLRYIAMQGPTEASLDYVWRMMAEQLTSPIVIVQLTNMIEQGIQKCFPYFPTDPSNASWHLGTNNPWADSWSAHIRLDSTQTLADGAIELRKLTFRVHDDTEDRTVWHFLYTKWPDFGVPMAEDLDSFFELMRLSREHNTADNPRVIHCSAGVGRTGTFITLEHLIRELDLGHLENYDGDAEGPDLIFKTVDTLREQRRAMVQAEAQYMFIYQVLRKLWLGKYDEIEDDEQEPAAKRLEVGDHLGTEACALE